MAREWHVVYDGWLEFGIDWFTESYDDRVVVDIHVYRWDNWNTDNSGGRFWESLNPDPNNGNTYAEWTDLTYGSGSGTRQIDDWATRTYYRNSSGYNVALRVGWDSSTGTYTSNGFEYVGSGSHTWNLWIDALPAPNTYTISFNDNGGSGGPGTQTKTAGTNLTISSTVPTREGYVFQGWSYAKSAPFADLQPGGTITQDVSFPLYAVWEQGCPHSNISSAKSISWCLDTGDINCCDDDVQQIYICKDCGKIKVISAQVCSDCCGTVEQSIWDSCINKWVNPTILLRWHTIIHDSVYTSEYPYKALNYYALKNKDTEYASESWAKKIYKRLDKFFSYDILYEEDTGGWPYSGYTTNSYPINLEKSAFNYQKLIIELVADGGCYHTCEVYFPHPSMQIDVQSGLTDGTGVIYFKMGGIIISEDGMQINKNGYLGQRTFTDTTSAYLWGYFFKITRVIGIKHI